MKKAIFLMGVSGAGKRTVIENLLLSDQFEIVNTCTTRPMRPGEKNGYLYDFVSHEQFMQWVGEGDFLEYALVHQKYYYGTRKSRIFEVFDRGHYPLKEMEMNGWEKICADKQKRSFCRSIFFNIDDEAIAFRLRDRDATISDEEVARRLASAQKERVLAPNLCDFYFDVTDASREEQADLAKIAIEHILAEE